MKLMTLEFLLPDTNPQDGLFSAFYRELDTCLKGKTFIRSIKPTDGGMILFSCELYQKYFDKFEKIYQHIYGKPFSVNWEEVKK